MKIIHTKEELQKEISKIKKSGNTIGFVPTMGFLHEGHLSLVNASKKKSDQTMVSIFVNPTQFNDPKDLEKYPTDIEGDCAKLKRAGVDLVWIPKKEDVYGNSINTTKLENHELSMNLCGAKRPGHFNGVLQIVSKLFHLFQPDFAFFGKKDYQQWRIIEAMVKDLDFPIEVIGIDTMREKDGLAMSSRNSRLGAKEKEVALLLPRSFQLANKLIQSGEKDAKLITSVMSEALLTSADIIIDYIQIVDPFTLQIKEKLERPFLIASAIFVGQIRLIDNKEYL
jgi:pantoate--beta-alanine ligase